MQIVKLAVAAASCVAIQSAAAQPAAPPPPPRSTQSVLPNVMSTDAGAGIDVRADYTKFDSPFFDDGSVFVLNLHGQYITPSGAGGYVALPFGLATGGDESETGVGNLELGGLYVVRQPDVDFYLRAGLAANTATDEGQLIVSLGTLVPRLVDAVTSGGDTNWIRAGGGLSLRSGAIVVGGSATASVALDLPGDRDYTALGLAGSVGVQEPGFGIAAGVAFFKAFGLEDVEDDDGVFGVNLVGDVPVAPQTRIYAAGGFYPEDELDGFSLGVGVRATM